jgi:molybdopterin synthase sulfur carrier subunit
LATVYLPSTLRPLAGGASTLPASGATLRDVLDDLERQHPGMRERILDAAGIRPDVMIAVGSDEVRDLNAPVEEGSEVHILPAIAGGSRAEGIS